ncbi:MAG: hypothetical protein K6L75_08020 [Cellvibrionaceae bacterium]
MADDQTPEKAIEEISDLDRLENSVKTNRLLFFVSLIFILLVAGFIAVSHLSITKELSLRREVASEELTKKFSRMESYLLHLSELQNSQAKLYMTFDDTLLEVREMYNDERVNQLRRLMIDREGDNQRILELMFVSVENLSVMTRADKKWLTDFKKKIEAAKKDSKLREQEIEGSLKAAG